MILDYQSYIFCINENSSRKLSRNLSLCFRLRYINYHPIYSKMSLSTPTNQLTCFSSSIFLQFIWNKLTYFRILQCSKSINVVNYSKLSYTLPVQDAIFSVFGTMPSFRFFEVFDVVNGVICIV